MTSDRWKQIEKLYHATLEIESSKRATFLDQSCAGDDELRREIESLLNYEARAEDFIESPAIEMAARVIASDQANSLVGQEIGHYKIASLLGSGGMGEVYLAEDSSLGRKVAVKLLPADFTRDAERVSRFRREARAASTLNHPNIITIYEIGQVNDLHYITSEFIDGKTLRQQMRDERMRLGAAIDLAEQVASALVAAHDAGIIHRDIKPENIMLRPDGLIKVLDFGLAKLTEAQKIAIDPDPPAATSTETKAGVLMGTTSYMSPEQARGIKVDSRSDLFSLGVVIYEMIAGRAPFQGQTTSDLIVAILDHEPPPLPRHKEIPEALEWIVTKALRKDRDARYQTAKELLADLKSLEQRLAPVRDLALEVEAGSASSGARFTSIAGRALSQRRLLLLLAGLVLLAGVAVAAYFAGRGTGEKAPSFFRLTFRRGTIHAARFAPDGHTIFYAAAWAGDPTRLFSTNPDSPESRPLGLPDAGLLSISSKEMAISLGRHVIRPWTYSGTLARVPLAGSAPREILEDIQWAEWAPNGGALAVVREVGGRNRLEFPIGRVLYETDGWIAHPRISPKGDLIAFLDHPLQDDGGSVAIMDLNGSKRTLSSGWISEIGLAWSADADEVWFTATRAGANRALYAVSLSRKERLVTRMAGTLTLHDISRDGRVLVTRDIERQEINCLPPGEEKERDLSWLDYSAIRGLSDDGKMVLISESGEGTGETYAAYLRKTDGSPAVSLGEVEPRALSSDGKWVIAADIRSSPMQLILLPAGPGEPTQLTNDGIQHLETRWFPDGKRFLFAGKQPDRGVRLYVQDLLGGAPRAITPEGVGAGGRGVSISPDGKLVTAVGPDEKALLYPVEGGEPRAISGLTAGDLPIQWSIDGRSLYLFRRTELPARIYQLDLLTGRKDPWKEIRPSDPSGVEYIGSPRLTRDGNSYAYSYARNLSDLYLVEGLK